MNESNTISLQEIRKDPLDFIQRIKSGKALTVIYRSKPLTTVVRAESASPASHRTRGSELVEALDRARASATAKVDPKKSLDDIYYEGMAKKYGIS